METFIDMVRSIYIGRRSGSVEVGGNGAPRRSMEFLEGEFFLDLRHPEAEHLEELNKAIDGAGSAAKDALLDRQRILHELVQRFPAKADDEARFRVGVPDRRRFIGPLPAVHLLEELAIWNCSESELFARLTEKNGRFRTSDRTPALRQLERLEPMMTRVLACLETPLSCGELLRGAGGDRLEMLQALAKLHAVGLVTDAQASRAKDPRDEVLSPRLLASLSERIAEDLEREPLMLDLEDHRLKLARLLAQLGDLDHYHLLDVGLTASNDAIYSAYVRLGRLVHPVHAGRLGLSGRDEASRVLFERATEAYLTLSDPTRRASYNTLIGIHREVEIDQTQRLEEKQKMAQQLYRQAAQTLQRMDYSLAIDMLKEATRMDPQPEYFARLAKAQAQNPHWHRHAISNFQRAVELAPEDIAIRIAFGELLEGLGRADEAKHQFQKALLVDPEQITARQAMERLGGKVSTASASSKTVSAIRNLFGGGS